MCNVSESGVEDENGLSLAAKANEKEVDVIELG